MEEINLQYTTLKAPLPKFIYDDLERFSNDANRYKPQPEDLIALIAKKHKLPKDYFYLTAGIDEALQMFIKGYAKVGTVFSPSYTVYGDIKIFGGEMNIINAFIEGKYSINTQQQKGDIIFLANPNNPFGYTEKEKLVELVKNNTNSVVVVDEAYGEFAPELSMISEIKKYDNLAVLRSFSKDYSMAGNRIGYIISNPAMILSVKDFTQWSNISYLSVGAAISALNHEEYFSKLRNSIIESRENLKEFLLSMKFDVLDSKINALLIKFDTSEEANLFVEYLNSKNIIVSHGNGNSNFGLDESFVRIAIGTDTQLSILKGAIREYMKS